MKYVTYLFAGLMLAGSVAFAGGKSTSTAASGCCTPDAACCAVGGSCCK